MSGIGSVSTDPAQRAVGGPRVLFLDPGSHQQIDAWFDPIPGWLPEKGDRVALAGDEQMPGGYWYEVQSRYFPLSYVVHCFVVRVNA